MRRNPEYNQRHIGSLIAQHRQFPYRIVQTFAKLVNLKGLQEIRKVVSTAGDNFQLPGALKDIVALFNPAPTVSRTTLRQCIRILMALLMMTGRVRC